MRVAAFRAYTISLLVCLWLALLAATAPTAHAQEGVVAPSERVTRFVYVRKEPSGGSEALARLQPGETAPLVDSIPRWHEVRLGDGRTGFVSKSWTMVRPGPAASAEELRIHFLSTGAGTCTVVECPGANAPPMIIDCGSFPGSRSDMALTEEQTRERIRSILARHSAVPNVVLSHGDIDHYNLIPKVLEHVRVGNIWQGGLEDTYGPPDGAFRKWLTAQTSNGAKLHNGLPPRWHNNGKALGEGLSCGLASTYVLTVNTDTREKNASSLMLMIEYGEFTAIFSADADGLSEESAAANFHRAVKATVLTASHHGAQTHKSNNARWIAATSPNVVIYSSGKKYGHPRCPVTQRFAPVLSPAPVHKTHCNTSQNYSARKITTSQRADYVTDAVGSVVVSSNGRSPAKLACDAAEACDATVHH